MWFPDPGRLRFRSENPTPKLKNRLPKKPVRNCLSEPILFNKSFPVGSVRAWLTEFKDGCIYNRPKRPTPSQTNQTNHKNVCKSIATKSRTDADSRSQKENQSRPEHPRMPKHQRHSNRRRSNDFCHNPSPTANAAWIAGIHTKTHNLA